MTDPNHGYDQPELSESGDIHALGPLDFLKRASGEDARIVSSGDLSTYQIAEAQADNRFFVDGETGLGWAILPWELSTEPDRQRERQHFAGRVM